MRIGVIGRGAIARYVQAGFAARGHRLAAILLRADRASASEVEFNSVATLPNDLDVVIDCAGHAALSTYGPDFLRRGIDMITLSLGALADRNVDAALKEAAVAGGSQLYLASGAIGALDCLAAARVGQLRDVEYVGRKPPKGWRGSAAETKIDLNEVEGAMVHFEGNARDAALEYPKNANVAAAVALAGLGFDNTRVTLIADAQVQQNVHEIKAAGDFGQFAFQVSGHALPDNPRSSALAAMSVLAKLDQINRRVSL